MGQIAHPHEPTPGSAKSLADVIERIEADQVLPLERRRDMLSAVRTVVRLVNIDAASLSVDPACLRERLTAVSPAAGGLSQGRWNNVRSLFAASLKHAGVQVMAGRSQEPLAFGWGALSASLPDATFRYGLSRFMRFCSERQTPADRVDAAVLASYRRLSGRA